MAPRDDQHPDAYWIGLDLGQAQDYTAISVLARTWHPTGRMVTPDETLQEAWEPERWKEDEPLVHPVPEVLAHYRCLHLERLPLNMLYPRQVEAIREVVEHVNQRLMVRQESRLATHLRRLGPDPSPRALRQRPDPPILVVDYSGVGRGIVDHLAVADLPAHLVPITITGGTTATSDGRGGYAVPKSDLVGTLRLLLETGGLKWASGLPDAATLERELQDFRVKISAALNERFEHRTGAHDDLVLSVAIAAWVAERLG